MFMLVLHTNVSPLEVTTDAVIYIRTDGSIEPLTAPLQREGRVYTLTANIKNRLEVLRDDIVIDGDGYTLRGNGSGIGVLLVGVNNVTVQHINVKGHEFGVSIEGAFNTVQDNNITDNIWFGVGHCASSVNNTVVNNYISGGKLGVWFCTSFNNSVLANTILNFSDRGIWIEYSSQNRFHDNLITNNEVGVALLHSSNNKFYGNNFVNNTRHVKMETPDSTNLWNNVFPQGGNYWDNQLEATDLLRGPHQNETGSDGISDTPFTVDEDDSDRYPLMKPMSGAQDVGIQQLTSTKTVIAEGQITILDVKLINFGRHQEDFNVTVQIGSTIMQETPLTLRERESAVVEYTWNTTDFPRGNYVVAVYTTSIQNELDTSDNMLVERSFVITIMGDVDGDFDVDVFDVAAVAGAYGPIKYDREYTGNYDLIWDGKIDIFDVVLVISKWQNLA